MKLSEAMRMGAEKTEACKGRFYESDDSGIVRTCAIGAAVFALRGQTMPLLAGDIRELVLKTWKVSWGDLDEIGYYNDTYGRKVGIEFTEAQGY